jgi:hypothetical protein|eukprot:COSAG01_NODE_683_length_14253_cov_33.540837_20_plen_88_part_00
MATPASDPAATYAYDHSETEWYIEANGVKTLMAKLLKDIVVSKPEDPILCVRPACLRTGRLRTPRYHVDARGRLRYSNLGRVGLARR